LTADTITASNFAERVVRLLGSPLPGLPRKRRDRHILLKAALLCLKAQHGYAQGELDTSLMRWLAGPGSRVGVDHVALRRCLVDEGYLVRDPAGALYRTRPEGRRTFAFDPEVEDVDVEAALLGAADERERRKRERRKRERGGDGA